MKSRTTANFRKRFKSLPSHIRQQARDAYKLVLRDPYHTSLYFKRIHATKPFYSARVGLHHRAVAVREDETLIWFWIGSHADYDKLISQI